MSPLWIMLFMEPECHFKIIKIKYFTRTLKTQTLSLPALPPGLLDSVVMT